MKAQTIVTVVILSFIVVGGPRGYAQGTFRNLGFERPILPLIQDNNLMVPASNAIPGWTAYLDSFRLDRVGYNTISLGSPQISLEGPGFSEPAFQGSYFVILQGGIFGSTVTPSIAQTGMIPQDARSLLFYANPLSSLQPAFAGQLIPLVQVGTGPNYVILGGDITGFAGQTGELRFTGNGPLDNIQFSNQPIPEPGVLTLLSVGAFLFISRFRRRD